MAILIKGMEMPENCAVCCCSNELYERCGVNDGMLYFANWYEARPDWCPLVEVPEPKAIIAKEDLEAAGFET